MILTCKLLILKIITVSQNIISQWIYNFFNLIIGGILKMNNFSFISD